MQSFLHLDLFEDALALVEKAITIDIYDLPDYILLYADVLVLFDTARALEKYTSFLEMRNAQRSVYKSDNTERNEIHPRLMIAQILIENKDFNAARELLEYIVLKTMIKKTHIKAQRLIKVCLNAGT